ncbi:MAG TPA: hypothetical protein VIR64_08105 [Pseudobacillus sp.]
MEVESSNQPVRAFFMVILGLTISIHLISGILIGKPQQAGRLWTYY